MHYDIVIAGGGFAGAYCARTLGKALGPEAASRVALVAQRNVLVFQPMLAEVAGSSLSALDVVNPLRQFCRGVSVLQGTIEKIDWAGQELALDGGPFTRNHRVGFTRLVVALGGVTDLSSIPGLSEYGRPMKDLADALRLRTAVINRLEEASLADDPEVRRRLLTMVVVGGGYTGVETAGQLTDFVRQAFRYYPELKNARLRMILVHAGEELLPEIGPSLGAYARKTLERRGIEVRLRTKVVSATARRVHLDDGTVLESNTVVSTVGNAPNPIVLDLCRQLGLEPRKGRIPVGPTMQVAGQEGLWAMGDCAAVPWDDRGQPKVSPATAQFAVRQGVQLAKNLLRVSRGQPARPFRHRYIGQLATIGEHHAVAEVMGLHFRGLFAWWLWRTIYLAKLPGALRRLRVTVDWTFDLIFPRDISLIMPAAGEVLRAIHLDAGDSLFHRGELCRACFYVRRGRLRLLSPLKPERTLEAGGLVDDAETDAEGRWTSSASAVEACELILFRGLARELLQKEVTLKKR